MYIDTLCIYIYREREMCVLMYVCMYVYIYIYIYTYICMKRSMAPPKAVTASCRPLAFIFFRCRIYCIVCVCVYIYIYIYIHT